MSSQTHAASGAHGNRDSACGAASSRRDSVPRALHQEDGEHLHTSSPYQRESRASASDLDPRRASTSIKSNPHSGNRERHEPEEIGCWSPVRDVFDFTEDGKLLRHRRDYICDTPLQPKSVRIVVVEDEDPFPDEYMEFPADRSCVECIDCLGEADQPQGETGFSGSVAVETDPAAIGGAEVLPLDKTTSKSSHPPSMNSNPTRPSSKSTDPHDKGSARKSSNGFDKPILEPTHLFDLWDKNCSFPTMDIRAWRMFDFDNELDYLDSKDWSGSHGIEHGDMVTIYGKSHHVISTLNTVQVSWKPNDSFFVQVKCLIPKNHQGRIYGPLGKYLRPRFCSQTSAMTLYGGNTDVGVRLATFDILDAMLSSALVFLRVLREKVAWRPRSYMDASQVTEMASAPIDQEYIAEFPRIFRHLTPAIELNIQSIRLYSSSFSSEQSAHLENLILESTMRCNTLRSLMADIQDRVEAVTMQAEKNTAQSEQASIKLLTFISAIFLPLTASCSLLSMGNRVTAIGAIWWDWLCIAILISFIVVRGYRLTIGAQSLGREPLVRRLVQTYRKARKETLEAHKKTDQDYIVPVFPRYLFAASKLGLLLAIAAALFVGMFLNVSLGAQILGFSIIGALGLIIGGIWLWRAKKILKFWAGCFQCCCITDTGDNHNEKPGEAASLKATKSGDSGTQRPGRKAFWCCAAFCGVIALLPLIALLMAVFGILAFVIGKLAFEVLVRMICDIVFGNHYFGNLTWKDIKEKLKSWIKDIPDNLQEGDNIELGREDNTPTIPLVTESPDQTRNKYEDMERTGTSSGLKDSGLYTKNL